MPPWLCLLTQSSHNIALLSSATSLAAGSRWWFEALQQGVEKLGQMWALYWGIIWGKVTPGLNTNKHFQWFLLVRWVCLKCSCHQWWWKPPDLWRRKSLGDIIACPLEIGTDNESGRKWHHLCVGGIPPPQQGTKTFVACVAQYRCVGQQSGPWWHKRLSTGVYGRDKGAENFFLLSALKCGWIPWEMSTSARRPARLEVGRLGKKWDHYWCMS